MRTGQRIGIVNTEINIAPSCQVCNVNTRQREAIIERRIANACDTVGNGDTRQARAICERLIANACYRQMIIGVRNNNIRVGAGTNTYYGITFAIVIQSKFEAFAKICFTTNRTYPIFESMIDHILGNHSYYTTISAGVEIDSCFGASCSF